MKKIVRVEVAAEIEIDTEWYGTGTDRSDETILELEKNNWQEWIVDHVVSEKLSIRDV